MINDEEIVFIDYQGGRKGALAYDVASLLFESKINLPFKKRVEYLNYYISKLEPSGISAAEFKKYYYPYVLIRLMQAMGAYGFRGIIENKPLFVESIPLAQKSLQWIFNNIEFDIKIPEIFKCLKQIANEPVLTESGSKNNLTVSIKSFSYRRGIPQDNTGNGGGFVFDCRAIHNPGRYDTYRPLTGKDKPVQDFLKKEDEMSSFLKHVFALAENTIDKYIIRGFSNLSINFGCTGGQHRSVYAAEMLHKHLSKKYNLNLDLKHLELTKVNFLQ